MDEPQKSDQMLMSVSFLIELSPNSQNVKPKDRNERGETTLHICAKKGDLEGAKKLLEQGMDPNVTDFAGLFLKNLLSSLFLHLHHYRLDSASRSHKSRPLPSCSAVNQAWSER